MSAEDQRKPGEAFCADCPDHEGCMTGYPCDLVKRINLPAESASPAQGSTRDDGGWWG